MAGDRVLVTRASGGRRGACPDPLGYRVRALLRPSSKQTMVAIPLDFGCRALVYPLTFGAETMARVTRREPCLSIDGPRMPKHVMFFRSAKAKRDLGYKAQPYSEALKEVLAWFRGTGQRR